LGSLDRGNYFANQFPKLVFSPLAIIAGTSFRAGCNQSALQFSARPTDLAAVHYAAD